jgi:hypothetical protein
MIGVRKLKTYFLSRMFIMKLALLCLLGASIVGAQTPQSNGAAVVPATSILQNYNAVRLHAFNRVGAHCVRGPRSARKKAEWLELDHCP